MSRIGPTAARSTQVSTSTNTASSASSQQAQEAPQVGEQMQNALFGKAKPPILDIRQFPQLAEQMKLLNRYRKKLATMAGDEEEDYQIVLADGTIAMIDQDGVIYMGLRFLELCKNNPALLVGVLAHEIGHQPKKWKKKKHRRHHSMTRDELNEWCRAEETLADIFAGKALAEMDLAWEPMAEFLEAIEEGPHPEYHPAEVRAQVIEEAYQDRAYRVKSRRKLFPAAERMHSAKGHVRDL